MKHEDYLRIVREIGAAHGAAYRGANPDVMDGPVPSAAAAQWMRDNPAYSSEFATAMLEGWEAAGAAPPPPFAVGLDPSKQVESRPCYQCRHFRRFGSESSPDWCAKRNTEADFHGLAIFDAVTGTCFEWRHESPRDDRNEGEAAE